MCPPTRVEVLRLYKNLLRYGQSLKYTDKDYFYDRIRTEFINNKEAKENDLDFSYKRNDSAETEKNNLVIISQFEVIQLESCRICFSLEYLVDELTVELKMMSFLQNHKLPLSGLMKQSFLKAAVQTYFPIRCKPQIDRSKVPELNENDLEETFVKGSGPGGQNVNKRNTCVNLCHVPTGIIIKCHQTRDRERNRKIARELLTTKLDNLYNGEDSVENQKKRILEKKNQDAKRKRQKLLELKELYKKRNEEDKTNEM